MKIMTVHNRYRSVAPSGENKVVVREAEALCAKGHEVIRFERSSDEIESWSKLKKALLPARIIWNGQSRQDMAAAINQFKPDIVHVHNTFPLLSASILQACYDARVPVVATLHNKRLVCASGDFFRDGAPCHDCASGSSFKAVAHGCYRDSRAATVPVVLAGKAQRKSWESLVTAYVFVSASVRDLLAGMAFPRERVFVRHHLIPRQTQREAAREPVIFYAGRLDDAKGVRVLMEAWDGYLSILEDPALRLLIAGAGSLERDVTAWASTRASVELVGHVDSSRCLDLMSRARAVVLPSTCEETFGLVAVEAMALGVPAVAAAHGAFPEIITHGADGVLTKPGDSAELARAIASADKDPAQYERYGEQARKVYEARFDPDDNINQLLEIYRYSMAHPVWECSLLRLYAQGWGDNMKDVVPGPGSNQKIKYYKKDFWRKENLKFARPHYRLVKCANIVNKIAQGKERSLLDVGCGPAFLRQVLDGNIHYHGIDIAIQEPSEDLIEADFLEAPIRFKDEKFDIIVAQGVFEYVGKFQTQKLDEIASLLNDGGKFVATYVNFGHRDREIYAPYSNVQSRGDFRGSLARNFTIERQFPTSHNWSHSEPNRRLIKAVNMRLNANIPVISPMLAVEYFYICSVRK